jgi:hypothetical protein
MGGMIVSLAVRFSRETTRASVAFMNRPRWHDAVIVTAIAALLAVGVWALWWEDVRGLLNLGPSGSDGPAPVATGKT